MRNFQLTDGLDVSIGIVRKHHNTVSDVVFYRIDVPVLRVHVNTTVELDIGLRTSNQPLRFGTVGIGRRIVQPVEDADAPRVLSAPHPAKRHRRAPPGTRQTDCLLAMRLSDSSWR